MINQATNLFTRKPEIKNFQHEGPGTGVTGEEDDEEEPGPGEVPGQVPGEEQVQGEEEEQGIEEEEEEQEPGPGEVPGTDEPGPGTGEVPGTDEPGPGTDEPGTGQEPGQEPVEGGKNNRSWWKKALGMSGGNFSDSEYESDGSIISSDDDKEDIVPFSTAFFEDDDEEDIMQHIRNMKSKKYLKTLGNTDLRDILKKNNQKVTKNSNYLSKKDMIKSITQFYK